MKNTITECIQASVKVKNAILEDEAFLQRIEDAVSLILSAFQNGKRVYFCGNGGSAADAQHLSAELSGRFYMNRKALPAEALHCNGSYLTAVANDFGYDEIYARLVEGMLEPGDVLIGFSTSGNSPNIVKAFETARSRSISTIGFTGVSGGKLMPLSDILFNVPSVDTPRIQESHIMVGHIICQLVEAQYFV